MPSECIRQFSLSKNVKLCQKMYQPIPNSSFASKNQSNTNWKKTPIPTAEPQPHLE
jgi:hypothetical protein